MEKMYSPGGLAEGEGWETGEIRADVLAERVFMAFGSKIYRGMTLFHRFDACVKNRVKIRRTFIANITSYRSMGY